MLPSVGLFRAFPCPYFIVGLCERPQCIFRHSRSDVEAARRESYNQCIGDDEKEDEFPLSNAASSVNSVADKKQEATKLSPVNAPKRREKRTSERADTGGNDDSPRKKRKLDDSEVGVGASSETGAGDIGKEKPKNRHSSSSTQHRLSGDSSRSHKSRSSKSEESSSKSTSRDESDRKRHRHDKDHKSSSSSSKSRSSSSSSKSHSHRTSSSSDKHKSSRPSSSSGSSDSRKTTKSKEEQEYGLSKDRAANKLTDGSKPEEMNAQDVVTIDDEFRLTLENDLDNVRDSFYCPSDEDDDPDSIALECLAMFKQYGDETTASASASTTYNLETLPPEVKPQEPESDNSEKIGKKRVAHEGAQQSNVLKPPMMAPPKRRETLAEQLHRRYQATQEASPTAVSGSTSQDDVPGGLPKKRMAHVANVSALMKPRVSETSTLTVTKNGTKTSLTLSQTMSKGDKRVAHVSVKPVTTGKPPRLVPDPKSKIPLQVRQKHLENIYKECMQIYQDHDSAEARSLEEEKALLSKCSSAKVYTCSAVSLITRLRKEVRDAQDGGSAPSGSLSGALSHSEILAGKAGNTVSWSIERKTVYRPVGVQLYSKMAEYIMSATELEDHGFPLKCPQSFKGCSGLAIIKPREDEAKKKQSEDLYRKICDRCGSSFLVDDNGFPVTTELCTYHAGRKYGRRTRTGNAEARYNCCDGEANSIGCCTAACHVHTSRSKDFQKNFVCAALDPGNESNMGSDPWDIVAVDCEMVYTTAGSELARATFVGVDGKVLYDTLVKPTHAVLDYNTRYSGIEESMLVNTSTTISDVHLKIMTKLRPNSIVIGHSLENDLIALKLVHHHVIDTSVVFPHKRGLPFKRALRNLSAEYLGKIIQVGEGGHDSAEDAQAALDLMLWKVKNDAAAKGSTRKAH